MQFRQKIKEQLDATIHDVWPDLPPMDLHIEYPPNSALGDYASGVALQLAGKLNMPPREIAEKICARFLKADFLENIRIEGGGFLNFTLTEKTLCAEQKQMMKKGATYATVKASKPLHINVEFISANPTGPLTLANGRGGFYGDALSMVFTKRGHLVEREYYVNDAGNQVNILAESVLRKHFTLNGIPMEYPDYCYKGAYIDTLARDLKIPNYNIAKYAIEEIRDKIKDKIVAKMLKDIQKVIAQKMQISFDDYFSEKTLYGADGPVEKILERLREMDAVYEKDNALWLKTQAHGDEKDRVLRKSDGTLTYLVPDIAHHLIKLEKNGFDKKYTILGADHHGYVDRMLAAMDMFGYRGRVELIIMQMIRLMQDGKEVRMSKRAGTYVPIEELIDDVGLDAVRFFFLMHASSTHMDFNLELAKERSEKNPVYYVQYAHARMCSILKVAKEKGKIFIRQKTISPDARKLLLLLVRWPEVLEDTERDLGVHRLPQFATDVATAFHAWYTKERVVDDTGVVNQTRLDIVSASQIIISDILSVMGISSPQRMD